MANSIVNGIETQHRDVLDVVRLNLLSSVGRSAAIEYGVRVVPATLLFNGQGLLVARQTGMPDPTFLVEQLGRSAEIG